MAQAAAKVKNGKAEVKPVGRASSRAESKNKLISACEHHTGQRTSAAPESPPSGVHVNLGQSNFVLLTITTENRDPWLANETAHRLLHQTWSEATAWLVGDYLLMPDHLHCFCAPRDLHFTIETWISYWKREFALKRKRLAGTLAPPPAQTGLGGASVLTSRTTLPEWKFQSRAGIIGCVMARAIPRNGSMCRRIRSEKNFAVASGTGRSKAKSST